VGSRLTRVVKYPAPASNAVDRQQAPVPTLPAARGSRRRERSVVGLPPPHPRPFVPPSGSETFAERHGTAARGGPCGQPSLLRVPPLPPCHVPDPRGAAAAPATNACGARRSTLRPRTERVRCIRPGPGGAFDERRR